MGEVLQHNIYPYIYSMSYDVQQVICFQETGKGEDFHKASLYGVLHSLMLG